MLSSSSWPNNRPNRQLCARPASLPAAVGEVSNPNYHPWVVHSGFDLTWLQFTLSTFWVPLAKYCFTSTYFLYNRYFSASTLTVDVVLFPQSRSSTKHLINELLDVNGPNRMFLAWLCNLLVNLRTEICILTNTIEIGKSYRNIIHLLICEMLPLLGCFRW